ncbi:MAG: DUF1552 domain-containing protein [Planctomycetota bacterium]
MHNRIGRRTLLRAAGVSLALPMLESMAGARESDAPQAPKRMVFLCNTLGLHPGSLWPDEQGRSKYLDLLQEHRQDFTLFSGLSHGDQAGRQAHDSEITWLTAARKPGMDGFRNSISVDQVAANHLGYVTRNPSIVLGTQEEKSQSYTSGGVMIPAQTSPATLFARLFLQGKPEEIKAEKRKLEQGQSILDGLKSQTKSLQRRTSRADNHLLNDFMDSVRQTEKNIGELQGWMDRPKPVVDAKPPQDIQDGRDLIGRIALFVDLIPLILQTDSSRVVTLMIQDHGTLSKIAGVDQSHHILSHHGQDEQKIKKLQRIESSIVTCFASLIAGLKSRQEQSNSLLQNTSVLFGSNLGNANAHDTNNLPILFAGGSQNHGSFVQRDSANNTQLSNLFVTMLQEMAIECDAFGQSTGTLTW